LRVDGARSLVKESLLWFRGSMSLASGRQNGFLRQHYDRLWSGAIERIASGAIEIDSVLAGKQVDWRRGMTLLLRPSSSVQDRITKFFDQLREFEPEQYYYDRAELHVTFLSLFTATEKYESFYARTEDYAKAVASCMDKIRPFPISFTGITASPGALMLQGFTDADRLNAARDVLRQALCARGLDAGLDQRYRLETAHMTVVRFRQPLRDGKIFAEVLQRARTFDFGQMEVDAVELVKNDWYMSRAHTEVLGRYPLVAGAS